MPWRYAAGLRRFDLKPLRFIALFFVAFFAPVLFTGRYFVGGDALIYSYPLRTVAWDI